MINIYSFLGLVCLIGVGLRLLFRASFFDKIIGLTMLSHGVNLTLLFSGSTPPQEKSIGSPSFLPAESFEKMVDPLPQALILTAIVIGFAVTAFMLLYSLYSQREDS